MVRLSQLFEATRRESAEQSMESTQTFTYASSSPQSTQSVGSSNPGSPAVSLFSARTHNRFPSSTSSLASSPGLGSLTEGYSAMKTQLTDVKEEPLERETSFVGGSPYFAHFNQVHADDVYTAVLESHEYDLSDDVVEKPSSPKKRKSDSSSTTTSFRGISRLSNRFTSMSSKWKHKQGVDTAAVLEKYDESLRSRANSATSTLVSPTVSSLSVRQGHNSPSPARTVFEDRLSEAGISSLDVDMANRQSFIEREPKPTTPLLPPLMMNLPNGDNISPTQSPLQSPSVADVTDYSHPTTTHNSLDTSRPTCLPSPTLSQHASQTSINRPMAAACRAHHVPDTSPVVMPDTDDEWSDKLGHANFIIRPEPYLPAARTLEAFEEHRNNWELARCNYAKHLIRISEHYGTTSNIYRLTEKKWDSVEARWRENHDQLAASLEDSRGNPVSLNKPGIHVVDAIKIPRLDDKSKFPDRGDEDIVGPMSVAPVLQQPSYPSGKSLRKRTLFKFLQDLFSPGIKGIKA
ncbi:hypothetical protein AJ78_05823 [Emergomyces pasteurianus Ep9510]|uniref:Only prolin and serin are matching in the corresponding protein n=1 Tax=Emergomyces pasteurianus Ep9510 TaxID=1447872 RepID=A0A1J9QCU8_9EURO|nr:hypothetical protein AJ78_05823 [Emergomyces pasteurianus Ep9510]